MKHKPGSVGARRRFWSRHVAPCVSGLFSSCEDITVFLCRHIEGEDMEAVLTNLKGSLEDLRSPFFKGYVCVCVCVCVY